MNKNVTMRNVLAGLVLASSGLFTAGASAGHLVAWDFATDGGFVTANSTCTNGPTQASCSLTHYQGLTPSSIPGTATIMTWGTGTTMMGGNGEQSALQGIFGATGEGPYNAQDFGGTDPIIIDEFQQIVTNAGWTNTGVGVHYNNVILSSGGSMDTATLRTSFQLLAPLATPAFQTDINFDFNETANAQPCAFANPHGTICDDIFLLSSTLAPIPFSFMGQDYVASFRVIGGPGAIVQGGDTIFTAEMAPGTALFFIQGRIDTVPVPGVLALMGMGLVMIGWRARRRRTLV